MQTVTVGATNATDDRAGFRPVDEELARWMAERDPEADWAAAAQVAERLAPTVVGLSVPEATQRAQADGVILRVVRVDGAPRVFRADRRPNRVNVDVKHDVIVSAEVG